ncbi:hypothetical protein XarjCFBP7645_17900 [Xanthomonas arboricola]|uniref:Uncharacterized protein n=1 Tax=Xanthomonas arboricola TaxID=56448 RepID=A0A2S7AB86_9XANT|nr:hypothetical protein XarjCFBP7645_17900 [Xanthomonas arboricola]
MPRKSLHGRTCGASCDGGRARALQQSRPLCLAASPAMVGGQGLYRQAADQSLYDARTVSGIMSR